MSVIQTRVTSTCRFDTLPKSAGILERNTTLESLPDDPSNGAQRLLQGIEKQRGIL